MSEEKEDKSQKTEQPTPHKLKEARKKGKIAQSQEVQHLFVMGAFLVLLWFMGPQICFRIFWPLMIWFSHLADYPSGGAQLILMMRRLLVSILLGVGAIWVSVMLAGVSAVVAQKGIRVSPSGLSPKLQNISLQKGLGRLFSVKGLVNFLKGLGKLALVGAVTFFILRSEFQTIHSLGVLSAGGLLGRAHSLVSKVIFSGVLVIVFLALADYAYQWFSTLQGLKMSKQEIKDEHKKLEFDPLVRRRQQERRMQIAMGQKQLKAVEEATVIITNPIHYAVALKWDSQTMRAPVVVAKGKGDWAARIRERARENFVPLMSNPPLARLLYRGVKIKQEILPEHYKAVAEVIRYVMELKSAH